MKAIDRLKQWLRERIDNEISRAASYRSEGKIGQAHMCDDYVLAFEEVARHIDLFQFYEDTDAANAAREARIMGQ